MALPASSRRRLEAGAAKARADLPEVALLRQALVVLGELLEAVLGEFLEADLAVRVVRADQQLQAGREALAEVPGVALRVALAAAAAPTRSSIPRTAKFPTRLRLARNPTT